MAELTPEEEGRKRLADVTEKLRKKEAELAFNRSEEGKNLNSLLAAADKRLKQESAKVDTEEAIAATREAILATEKDISQLSTERGRKLLKLERELEKAQGIRADKEKKLQRTFGDIAEELRHSLNPFKGIKKLLEGIVPKPLLLAGELLVKSAAAVIRPATKLIGKGLWGGAKMAGRGALGLGKMAGRAIRGPDESEKYRFDPSMAGGGRWREYDKKSGKMFGMVKASVAEAAGATKDEIIPGEDITGREKEKGFISSIGSGIKGLFGGGETAADVETPQDGFGLLHTDLTQIAGLLETFTTAATTEGSIFVHDARMGEKMDEQTDQLVEDLEPETIDASVQREGDIESKIPFIGGKKKKGKKGKGLMAMLGMGGGVGGMGEAMAAGFGGAGLAKGIGSVLSKLGPAAVILAGITSLALIAMDGVKGWKAAAEGEWDAGKVEGAIGGALGGMGSGGKNAAKQAAKGAAVGAMIGMVGGPVGMIIGAVVGAAIGGIAGFIGGKKIAEWLTATQKTLKDAVGFPPILTEDEKKAHQAKIKAIVAEIANLKSEIIPQIDKEIAVYTQLQKEGKELTLKEMEKLDELYQQKVDTQQQIIDGEKEKAVLERDLERQKLANLNQQKSELNDTKMKLQHALTEVGDTGQFVHGEIFALQQEVRILDEAINKARKEGHQTEVDMLTNQKNIAEKQLTNKKTMLTKVNEELEKTKDEIYAEQERLNKEGLLSGWEEFTFDIKTLGRGISGMWDKTTAQLAGLGKKIGAFIYTPGGESGPGGMGEGTPAKLFGVELKWPKFDIPSWGDIKEALPVWLKAEWWTTKWDDWNLPDWPTWDTITGWMPEWMTDPVGWIKGIFKRGDETADIEEKLREGTEKKKKLEDRKASVREEAQGARKQASRTLQFQRNVFTQKVTDVEADLDKATKREVKESNMFGLGGYTQEEKDADVLKAAQDVVDVRAHAATETTRLDDLESVAHGKITANETVKMAELDAESLVLQQEQTEHERKLATLVNNSVPHIKVMSIVDPADLGSTATILGAGAGGGGNAVVVNNITNATGGSTSAPTSVTNMNIMAGANDPHTSKQPNHMFGNY